MFNPFNYVKYLSTSEGLFREGVECILLLLILQLLVILLVFTRLESYHSFCFSPRGNQKFLLISYAKVPLNIYLFRSTISSLLFREILRLYFEFQFPVLIFSYQICQSLYQVILCLCYIWTLGLFYLFLALIVFSRRSTFSKMVESFF